MQAMKSLFVTICVIGLAFAEHSPVFVWGVNSVAKPSLPTISENDFAELVTPLLADKACVVFLEKDLSNKDFSCTNPATEKSCFASLRDVQGKTYYASVENPIEALRSVAAEREFNTIDASGKLSSPLELAKGKIVFVNFEDSSDESVEHGATLESHDFIIADLASKYGDDAFFMYTSAASSTASKALKRQRRDTTAASSGGRVFREGADFLLFYTTLNVTDGTTSTPLDMATMSISQKNTTFMKFTLTPTSGSPLSFDITLAGGYFFMTNVEYNNLNFRSTDVYSPTDFSYFCGNLTLNSVVQHADGTTTTWSLKWNSLQFQAPFGRTANATFAFGDPWHCVGFFTGGILSGLLIVALLLTITFIGVCWMMDINTMDRFDDPKGKTITINAGE